MSIDPPNLYTYTEESLDYTYIFTHASYKKVLHFVVGVSPLDTAWTSNI